MLVFRNCSGNHRTLRGRAQLENSEVFARRVPAYRASRRCEYEVKCSGEGQPKVPYEYCFGEGIHREYLRTLVRCSPIMQAWAYEM